MKLLLTTLFTLTVALSQGHATTRPNVVVVFIDDMGYSDFSCFGGSVNTQHVDQLASEGIKFTNFYVCLLYTSPSPRDATLSRMPSSA